MRITFSIKTFINLILFSLISSATFAGPELYMYYRGDKNKEALQMIAHSGSLPKQDSGSIYSKQPFFPNLDNPPARPYFIEGQDKEDYAMEFQTILNGVSHPDDTVTVEVYAPDGIRFTGSHYCYVKQAGLPLTIYFWHCRGGDR